MTSYHKMFRLLIMARFVVSFGTVVCASKNRSGHVKDRQHQPTVPVTTPNTNCVRRHDSSQSTHHSPSLLSHGRYLYIDSSGSTRAFLSTQSSPSVYPYTFLRIYLCGHPSDTIEVSRLEGQDQPVQTVIPPDTLERCPSCAYSLRDQCGATQEDGKQHWLRPMAAYKGQTMSVDRGLLKDARTGLRRS